ncbi:putative glucose-1-phosphate adenylyltransferase large subunit, chloroplastic [Glycine max]|nr:putative glucose-1-phosphate adenylyltransferase large subunit, chloroplastic [Glycine max]
MADEAKAKGNTAFSSGDYPTAIHYFSDAIALAPTNHVLKMRTCFAMGGDGHRNHHFTETVAMGGIGPTMGLDAKHANIENVLILAGDNLYRMDCMDLVQSHVEKNTDITVSCAAVGERLHDMLGGCMLEAFLLQLMSR